MNLPVVHCRSCQAPVVWVTIGARRMPLDAEPVPDGNVLVLAADHVIVYRTGCEALTQARTQGGALHLSHFATCPDASSWRRRR